MMESQAAEQKRPSYSHQSSRSYTLSRSVKELFPDSVVIRKRGFTVQLPGMHPSSSTPSGRIKKTTPIKPSCIPWRHFVTGGRAGAKYRKQTGIDRTRSYIDIISATWLRYLSLSGSILYVIHNLQSFNFIYLLYLLAKYFIRLLQRIYIWTTWEMGSHSDGSQVTMMCTGIPEENRQNELYLQCQQLGGNMIRWVLIGKLL